jgi:hypothetical protein
MPKLASQDKQRKGLPADVRRLRCVGYKSSEMPRSCPPREVGLDRLEELSALL